MAKRRLRLVGVGLLALAMLLVVWLGVALGGAWYVQHHAFGQVHRLPGVFSALGARPHNPAGDTGARNILLLGSDRRSDVQTTGARAAGPAWLPGAQRSDTIMLLHLSADRRSVTVVSIPRDSWVDIPGYGHHKINAAFSFGGPSLTVRTVEQLTGLRIDHLAIIDWAGFRALVDDLGGLTVRVPRTTYDSARRLTWAAGRHHLDGRRALLYVRQRHGLPNGDLDRVRRQQYVLELLWRQLHAQGLWTDPTQRARELQDVTDDLTVDSGWTTPQLRHFGHLLIQVPARNVRFTTAPVSGFATIGGEDVVLLDGSAGHALWRALDFDDVSRWFAAHPGQQLPHVVG